MARIAVCRLLLRGSMFVFSKPQLSAFLDVNSDWQADTLLDLGNRRGGCGVGAGGGGGGQAGGLACGRVVRGG